MRICRITRYCWWIIANTNIIIYSFIIYIIICVHITLIVAVVVCRSVFFTFAEKWFNFLNWRRWTFQIVINPAKTTGGKKQVSWPKHRQGCVLYIPTASIHNQYIKIALSCQRCQKTSVESSLFCLFQKNIYGFNLDNVLSGSQCTTWKHFLVSFDSGTIKTFNVKITPK